MLKSSPSQKIWVVAELYDGELYQIQAFARQDLAKEFRQKIRNEYKDTHGKIPESLAVEIYEMGVQR